MVSSMFGGEKERLHLTLNHRYDQPGYHWALVLSPKDRPNTEQETALIPDSDRWHLTNQASARGDSLSLIARFTLGKFKASDHEANMQRISAAVASIRIDHSVPDLSCRTWLLRVIDTLIAEQIVALSVPNAKESESRAIHEAGEVMEQIMTQRMNITKKSTIPMIDMRAKLD
ncbi:hypothetical protein DENSPDRAFT_861611 [Dentipellis sp. KUC8613]|nr:hypothetical protein DENSPDRAFT_861611 [Dentipellis sp. KUC8613]